jgi:putative ABC transport system permease protein
MLARLWVRAALRRPSRAALVVSGLLAMVLAVASAVIASDTMQRTLVADAKAQWGSVDATVSAPGGQLMDEGLARMVGSEARARAWAGRLTLPAVAEHATSRDPHIRLLGISEEERSFAEPLAGEGTLRPADLSPGEVIVNERLAQRLDLSIGTRFELMVAVPHTDWRTTSDQVTDERAAAAVPWTMSVAGIATDSGVADLGRTANVLTPLTAAQRKLGLAGKVSALHAAATDETPAATDQLVADLDEWADRLGLDVTAVEREALAIADDESGQFVAIFGALALLVVLGSVALTVNLLVLLGYERSREIALLRSAGARRRTVATLLSVEGTVYTLVAAIAGTALAVPLGDLLARLVADHFARIELARGREFVTYSASAQPGAIAVAVGLVLLVGLITSVLAARRVASLHIEGALRGLPPSGTRRAPSGPRRPALTAAAGVLLLGMGITAPAAADFLRFAGLSLLLAGWWLHARRTTGDRRRLETRAASAGLLWFIGGPVALGDFSRGVEPASALLATAGVGAVICATVLASARLRTVMRVVRGFLPRGRTQAATRTAAAWAEQTTWRTGTVIGLVAITLFMVGMMSVLGRATAIDLDRQRGGVDVIGTAIGPVDASALRRTPGVRQLVAMEHTTIDEKSFAAEDSEGARSELRWPVRLVRADHELAGIQSFALSDALDEFSTAASAVQGVLSDDRGVVLDRYSTPEGARPGDRIVVDLGGEEQEFKLLAVLDTYVLGGVIVGPARYDEMVANRGPTLVLATGNGQTDAAALSRAVGAAGRSAGLTMRPVSEVAREVTAINARFTDLFTLVLQVGLAVALLAVGALVNRAVRERRGDIAVLRATGFRRIDVVLAVIAEPLLLGVTGVLIGVVAGLGTLLALFLTGFTDLAFVVHAGQLGTPRRLPSSSSA